MRLDDARLCLDCEEIHQEQECPACGSEAFGFLTRWIKSTTRDTSEQPRPPKRPALTKATPATSRPTPSRDELDAWRRIVGGEPAAGGSGRKIITRGLMGLAAAGVAGWLWSRGGRPGDDDAKS